MAGPTARAELTTRTVVVEIRYFCTKNVVIHRKRQTEFTVGFFNNSDGEKCTKNVWYR